MGVSRVLALGTLGGARIVRQRHMEADGENTHDPSLAGPDRGT